MDIKALAEWVSVNGSSIVVAGLVFIITGLVLNSRPAKRVYRAIEETFFTNWQLALLASTGIVLSLASGYTTWDGMRNFTGEPLLSAMITFGIQGVMLIVAWLIGESFATGMNQRSQSGAGGWDLLATGLFAILALVAATVWAGQGPGRAVVATANWFDSPTAKTIQNFAMYGALTALLFALIIAMTKSDIGGSYVQSARVIVKNAVLWVMFIACAATSVFFSFDSLFTAIFPQSERVRAAELRAQNQVAGIISDIGSGISEKRLAEAETLFTSDGWRSYDQGLADLVKAAQGSGAEIETYFNALVEDKNRAIKQQQERIATAQSSQAGLQSRKLSLTDELSRLEGDRPALAADYAEKKSALDARAKEVDAKRVEAMAEDKGVEGTGKSGRGPVYKQRVEELGKLQDYIKIGEERVKDSKKRLDATETRIAQVKRELAAVDGDLAKYKGEAETAEQRIKLTTETSIGDPKTKLDPSRLVPQFEITRAEFRQDPTAERLGKVQQSCSQIYTAMATATPETKKKVAGIECDPKQAAEAAALVFALNAGSEAFGKSCAGGDRLAQYKTSDDLFGFARKCLADSGLPSKETDALRTKINHIELNRDDKAHRFVVTLNAFGDGNRLAYLALAIAIAIDSLVFMSGLFGANAVRSPLSDVPSMKARSAQQLEAIIENALLPDTFANAKIVLGAMHTITNTEGYVAEVDPHAFDPETASRLREVLSAGATIGAVRRDGHRYLVRAELFEFLSIVAKRAYDKNKSKFTENVEQSVKTQELEKMVAVALLPDISAAVDTVLGHLHPVADPQFPGFTSEIRLDEMKDDKDAQRVSRRVLNAGSTVNLVRAATDKSNKIIGDYYLIHADLYKTLARIRARSLGGSYGPAQIGSPQQGGVRDGGMLSGNRGAIPPPAQQPKFLAPAAAATPPQPPQSAQKPVPDVRASNAEALNLILESLVDAIGVDSAAYAALIERPDSFAAAVSASESFRRARLVNALLDEVLATRDDEARGSLNRQVDHLRRKLPSESHWALQQAEQEVEQNWEVLMLLPDGPYDQVIDNLILQLEPDEAERKLLPHQSQLLKATKAMRQSLRSGPRASEQDWRRVATSLEIAAREAGLSPSPNERRS